MIQNPVTGHEEVLDLETKYGPGKWCVIILKSQVLFLLEKFLDFFPFSRSGGYRRIIRKFDVQYRKKYRAQFSADIEWKTSR